MNVGSSMRMRTVDVGGPVHFADFGGAGAPLVLVHGLGGSHANWLAVAPGLATHGQVIAPDLPGFGRTPSAGRSARVPASRECLHRFLAAVGRPAVLVGNSMGGLIVMMEAALHPENVSALVLVAPAQPTPAGTRIDREILLAFAIYSVPWVGEWYLRHRATRLGPEGFVRELFRLLCVDPTRVPDEARRAHVALAAERLRRPDADRAFLEAARSLLGILRRRRSYDEMVGKIDRSHPLDPGSPRPSRAPGRLARARRHATRLGLRGLRGHRSRPAARGTWSLRRRRHGMAPRNGRALFGGLVRARRPSEAVARPCASARRVMASWSSFGWRRRRGPGADASRPGQPGTIPPEAHESRPCSRWYRLAGPIQRPIQAPVRSPRSRRPCARTPGLAQSVVQRPRGRLPHLSHLVARVTTALVVMAGLPSRRARMGHAAAPAASRCRAPGCGGRTFAAPPAASA